MCGIGGKLSFTGRPGPSLADSMNECMEHRGPDASGVYANGPVILAHRRLSILDLSDAGRQPMSAPNGETHVVFNGEIYNYRELRDRLGDCSFRSETDTEVLLHLYRKHGIECLSMLRGMFAFAIWDERKDRLFLARDRLGQKPLFYRVSENAFWFGSTIKTILADDSVTAAPQIPALREYLTYQYVPSPRTGFEGIRRLMPGEYMIVGEDEVERHRYWSVSFADQFTESPLCLVDELRQRLRTATRLRMRSDVPLGVFLSGGIDSSIVTALMEEISTDPIETYSVGFEVEEYDELEFAKEVAEYFGTNHHEYVVSPDSAEVLPELIEHYEMPFGDPSALPTYYIAKVAAEDITVALTGDAGDENFAGYDRYTYDRLATRLNRLPALIRQGGASLLRALPDEIQDKRLLEYGRRLFRSANGDPIERYAEFICRGYGSEFNSIWENDGSADGLEPLRRAFDRTEGPTRLDRILHVDINTYLPDDLLVKIDRASMAHSLEVRSPFLDHEFVSFAARIPAAYKYKGMTKKWLLKRAFESRLPEKVVQRSKQGFGVPIDEWFRGQLRDELHEALIRLGSRQGFAKDELLTRYTRHVENQADLGRHLWDLLILERWYERYID